MKFLLQIKLVSFFIFLSHFSSAKVVDFSDRKNIYDIGYFVEVMEDETGKLGINDVIKSSKFIPSNKKVQNLGVSNSTFWVRFSIRNTTNNDQLFLELAYPLIDYMEFYKLSPEGKISMETYGEFKSYDQRFFNHPNYIFDLNIPNKEIRTFYFKIKSTKQILLPFSLGAPETIAESLLYKDWFFGIYVGVILVMFFYNLFIYLTIRDLSYVYYVIYILSVGLVQSCLQGYTFKYLWPNSPLFELKSIFFLSAIIGITPIIFQKNFLQTKLYAPKLDKVLNVFIVVYIFYLILFLFGYTEGTYKLIQITAMFLSFYMLYVSWKMAKTGSRPAKFFFAAWIIFLVGVFIFGLKEVDILPYNNFTSYTMQIGSALETILLSFALADRINILKKEKEESQQKALQALTENERIIKEQNVVLEAKVEERTVELKKSNKELNGTLQDLKNTQSQLVNAEKMASLGQLTAGVAHEINNPINFVSSSIKPLKRDIGDLVNVLSKYDEINEDNFKEKVKEVKALKAELDIDYVKEEINSLLKGIDEGASRTSEIVMGLKTFSRLDENDLKRVDINEGLESTLIILNSVIMGKVKLVKEYGNIAKIECFAGKLNQVFMNILNNAIHAVLKKEKGNKEGVITIKTWEDPLNVLISIKDNGTGMSEETKNKIFDPFFTTKDVGEGTGLGLSIVYNIIESHKGKIEVKSELTKGTEFIITLPKNQGKS